MFDQPKTSVAYVAPAEPIDVMQRYLVRVVEIVDLGPTQFPRAGADPNKPVRRFAWHFRLGHLDGTPVLDIDGNPYIHVDYSNSTTTRAKTASGTTATARLWLEALMGRELEDNEIPNASTAVINKVAVALLEERESGGQRIVKLQAHKGAAAEAGEMAAAGRRATATVARARATAPPAEADDNEPPF